MNDFRLYHSALVHSDELYHFGILGMKWGVRRYQDPDGTLTEAGKKRYLEPGSEHALSKKGAKRYYKDLKKLKTLNSKEIYSGITELNFINPNTEAGYKKYKDHINKVSEKITEAVNATSTPEEIKIAFDAYEDFHKRNIWEDFFNSKEYSDMKKRAYRDVYDGLRKNDPEYLDEIIKRNNGSKKELWRFHDFRKILEGTEDEMSDSAQYEYAKNHKKEVDAYKASYEYYDMKTGDLLSRALDNNFYKKDFSGFFITLPDGRVIPLGIKDDFRV